MYKAAEEIVTVLIRKSMIKDADKDKYLYAAETLFEKIISFGLLFVISIAKKEFVNTCVFLITFTSIRKRTGGFHCKSFLRCIFGTVFLYVFITDYAVDFFMNYKLLFVITIGVSYCLIMIIGAVNNVSIGWDENGYQETKKNARIISTLQLMIIGIFMYITQIINITIVYMGLGMIGCALLLFWAKIKK